MEVDKNVITPKLAQHHQQKLQKVNIISRQLTLKIF